MCCTMHSLVISPSSGDFIKTEIDLLNYQQLFKPGARRQVLGYLKSILCRSVRMCAGVCVYTLNAINN